MLIQCVICSKTYKMNDFKLNDFRVCSECNGYTCKEHFDEDNKTCLRCNTKIAPNFKQGDKFIMKYSFEGEIFTVEEVRGTLLRVKMNDADLYLNRYAAIKV